MSNVIPFRTGTTTDAAHTQSDRDKDHQDLWSAVDHLERAGAGIRILIATFDDSGKPILKKNDVRIALQQVRRSLEAGCEKTFDCSGWGRDIVDELQGELYTAIDLTLVMIMSTRSGFPMQGNGFTCQPVLGVAQVLLTAVTHIGKALKRRLLSLQRPREA